MRCDISRSPYASLELSTDAESEPDLVCENLLGSCEDDCILCVTLRPLRLCGENAFNRRGAEDAELRREKPGICRICESHETDDSIPVLISRRVYAMGMWKYILASTLLVIGILEIVLALHGGLREALMRTSPVRLKQAESSAFLLAGISALVMGIGILFYGLFG